MTIIRIDPNRRKILPQDDLKKKPALLQPRPQEIQKNQAIYIDNRELVKLKNKNTYS
jgi:hypothetical protein